MLCFTGLTNGVALVNTSQKQAFSVVISVKSFSTKKYPSLATFTSVGNFMHISLVKSKKNIIFKGKREEILKNERRLIFI